MTLASCGGAEGGAVAGGEGRRLVSGRGSGGVGSGAYSDSQDTGTWGSRRARGARSWTAAAKDGARR